MYTLLIVDDEPLVRRGIKNLADLGGLKITKVLEAGNGEQALGLLSEEPDLILLDINMPKMDGLTFSKAAKEILPEVKICMVTGYDYFDYAIQALKIGVDDYILKPVSRKDIEMVLKKMLDKIESKKVKEALEELGSSVDEEVSFEKSLRNYVDKEIFNSSFSLTSTADYLGFSSNYLSGLFKDTYNMSFQDYVVKTRIERAKVLLLSSEKKNYEIANLIGIEDVNYFSTRFKKSTGLTPKQYKNKVRYETSEK